MLKCKFILKISNLKRLKVLADAKVLFRCNFGAALKKQLIDI